MNIDIRVIPSEDILSILPLLQKLNTKTPKELLETRLLDMVTYPNYECVGMFKDDILIGISGLWYSTRHYIGKSVEPDHVIIDENYRGQKLGNKFFNWIHNHVQQKDCEAIELNTYTANRKSHKFYLNEGYNIYGFHMLKILRGNKDFY